MCFLYHECVGHACFKFNIYVNLILLGFVVVTFTMLLDFNMIEYREQISGFVIENIALFVCHKI